MPENRAAPVTPRPFVSRRGERAVTLVLDAEDGIRVRVLRGPDLSAPGLEALAAFSGACHADRPRTGGGGEGVLDAVAAGRTLWQCAEVLEWLVLIEGMDRVQSHQLVRQRVGVTFSQQCTGDRDCRVDDVLVPRAYAQPGREGLLRSYVDDAVLAKVAYARDVDAGISIGEARRRLPHGMATFINVRWCLASLAAWFKQRREPMSQDWLTYVLAGKVREAVLAASPWAGAALREPRAAGSWYNGVKEAGYSASHIWSPKGTDYDDYEWNPATFEHGSLSHEEVSSGPPVPPQLWFDDLQVASGVAEVAAVLRAEGDAGRLSVLESIYGADAVRG